MMKHVSVFKLKEEYRKEELIEEIAAHLKQIPEKTPEIISSEIGIKPFPMPTESPDGHVEFYDLIQIIGFEDEKGCMSYPMSQGHQEFLAWSSEYFEKVIGIDYPM
jgi:hypothetical protein